MNKYETEIPKYLKQKESNISKAKKKSKHKHQYEECLIRHYYSWYKPHEINKHTIITTNLCSYCTICGKLNGKLKNSIVEDDRKKEIAPNGLIYYTHISSEELYEKFHNKLPVFFIEDYRKDGYVDLNEQQK